MDSTSQAGTILRKQFEDLVRNPIEGIPVELVDESNILQLNLTICGPAATKYEERIDEATMNFPLNYPDSPPTVKFTSEIRHPNVYPDGNVSIPILNPPGYESASECRSPDYTPCSRRDGHHFVLKSFNKQFKCDGCKQQGSGPRHICHNCDYELHEECKSPKGTTSHEFFGNLEFQFFEKPQVQYNGRCCDACGKDIQGFNYLSVDNRYDLHPCCSKLSKKLCLNDILFELYKKVSSKCIWCQKKKISGDSVPGWAYASRCGVYNFHVHCLMEMLHINASIKDGNLGLEKIDLRHLAKSKKRKGKTFLRTVKIFLMTVLAVLLGDPTTLLASAIVEAIFIG